MHTHHHGHDSAHGHNTSLKMLGLAIICTLVFAAIEAVGGYYANSLALLSDAGHMASDSLALFIAFGATWLAKHPPSATHSYGLGRAEVIAATLSSIMMIAICIIITVEAVMRIQSLQQVNGATVIIIASIGIVINLLIAYLLSKGQQTLNAKAALLHVIADLLGSVAAVTSGAIIYFTHWQLADPILSMLIALLISYSSIRLLKEALRILMEGVPSHVNLHKISQSLCEVSEVKNLFDLHVWTLSSGNIALSAHVQIETFNEWENVLATLRRKLNKEFGIHHVTLQPESAHTNDHCGHCKTEQGN